MSLYPSRKSRVLAMVLLVVFSASLTSGPATAASSARLSGERMDLVVESNPFALRVLDKSGAEMLATQGPVSYTTVTRQHVSRLVLYWLWTRGIARPWKHADTVTAIEEGDGELVIDIGKNEGGRPLARMRAYFVDGRTLRVESEVLEDHEVNRFRLRLKRSDDERYYGMGERFNSAEHSGDNVRVGGRGRPRVVDPLRVFPEPLVQPFPEGPGHDLLPRAFLHEPFAPLRLPS